MTTPTRYRVLAALPFALLLVFAGCSSDAGPGESPRGSAGGPRRKAPTPMAGHESFFDGKILAEIQVGTEGLPDAPMREGGGGGGGEGRGRRGGGGGGLNFRGGSGEGLSGNISGGVPFGGGGEGRGRRGGYGEGGESGEGGGAPRMRMGGGMGRPVMIHLRFTNQGTEPVTLVIDDFTSPLGNFAVQPEQLVLAPGQALETEPMTSQLAGEYSEVDATLVLRVGPKAEKKIFTLKAVPAPVPPAPDQAKAKDEPAPPAK